MWPHLCGTLVLNAHVPSTLAFLVCSIHSFCPHESWKPDKLNLWYCLIFSFTTRNWPQIKFVWFSWLLVSQKQIFSPSSSSTPGLSEWVIIWPGSDPVLTPADTSWPLDHILSPANLDFFMGGIRQDWDCVASSHYLCYSHSECLFSLPTPNMDQVSLRISEIKNLKIFRV